MKLVKCHIANFGILENVDIVFDSSLYEMFKENGEGKTTFLNFIHAMLFGLSTSNARNKEENLRSLYYPYNGGLFGGSLEIEKDNKIYRIERVFDRKSGPKDTLKITLNNKEIDIDIVKDILQLDEESFHKTLYFRNTDFDLSTPESLTNNILKLESASNISSSYQKAIESLSNKEKEYSKNSSSGIIKSLSTSILNSNKRKLELAFNEEEFIALKNEYTTTLNKILELEKERDLISSFEVLKSKEETKLKALEQLHNYEEKNQNIVSHYNNQIITVSDISKLRDMKLNYDTYKSNIKEAKLDENEENNYLSLNYLFTKNPLSKDDINSLKNKNDELIIQENKLNSIDLSINEEEKDIINLFKDKEIKQDSFNHLDELINEYNSLFNHINNVSNISSELENNKNNKTLPIIMGIVASLSLVGGIILIFYHLVTAIILFAITVLLFIFSFILFIKDNKVSSPIVDKKEEMKTRMRMKEIEEEIHKVCTKYAIYSSNINADYQQLKNLYQSYLSIINHHKDNENEKNELETNIKKIKEELFIVRSTYKIKEEDDLVISLSKLLDKYTSLSDTVKNYATIITTLKGKLKEIENNFLKIKEQYQLDLNLNEDNFIDKIDSYKIEVIAYHENEKQIKYWNDELERYQEGESDFDISSLRDKEEVIEELKVFKEKRNTLKKDIDDIEARQKEIEQEDLSIITNQEKLLEAEQIDRIYKLTLNALIKTNNIIISKYIDPIKNDFKKYASQIEDVLGEEVHLSSNFELEFMQQDSLRGYNHLSLGEKIIAGMVLRMAFINQLYPEDKPFILLDDPFANLDDNHLKKAIKLVKDLSKQMQIIYITCHPSRRIN